MSHRVWDIWISAMVRHYAQHMDTTLSPNTTLQTFLKLHVTCHMFKKYFNFLLKTEDNYEMKLTLSNARYASFVSSLLWIISIHQHYWVFLNSVITSIITMLWKFVIQTPTLQSRVVQTAFPRLISQVNLQIHSQKEHDCFQTDDTEKLNWYS